MADEVDEVVLAGKFAVMRRLLDERQWRVYLGTEALAAGRGGIAAVARASGASETTVARGAAEAGEGPEGALAPGRRRRPGAGRPRAEDAQSGLREALLSLAEAGTRGDPMAPLRWTTLSLRDLERQLAARGFRAGKDAVARILKDEGYSLQGMAKVLEGKEQHPDRDGQFRLISAAIAEFTLAGDPVVSVDGKKKEQLGPYGREGRSWRPAGDPVRALSHDFPDCSLGKAVPYGVYDIAANRGFAVVGRSRDTPSFAVASLRRWWLDEGSLRYPGARRLLVTCDAGGSNACASRVWKSGLAELAAETGLEVTVMHFPPGTSKWNKIEHRLFCHITRTWRARPLMTLADAAAGIAATVTAQGLKCTAVLDEADYPEGVKVPEPRMKYLRAHVIGPHPGHGEWNYTLRPAPPQPDEAPAPAPPGPDPGLVAALAALAGIPALPELRTRTALALAADRERRLTLARGGPRRPAGSPGGYHGAGGYGKMSEEAVLAAAACRIRLGMTWALLGTLLGVHQTSVSVPARTAIPVLEAHGITPPPASPRINTTAKLLARAAAAGITITIPEHQPPPHETADPTRPNPPVK